MRGKVIFFPGIIDILVVLFLVFLIPDWQGVLPLIAIIRIAIPGIFLKRKISSRGMAYDFMLAALSAIYILLWGGDDTRSVIVTYMGCAAAAEFFVYFLKSRIRMFK